MLVILEEKVFLLFFLDFFFSGFFFRENNSCRNFFGDSITAKLVAMRLVSDDIIDGNIEDFGVFPKSLDVRFDTSDFIVGDVVLMDMPLLTELFLSPSSTFAEITEIFF